jgi:hypothetical protein
VSFSCPFLRTSLAIYHLNRIVGLKKKRSHKTQKNMRDPLEGVKLPELQSKEKSVLTWQYGYE